MASDSLLDQLMPEADVAERHEVRVRAPAAIAFDAALALDLRQSAIIRAIFRAREVVLGAHPDPAPQPTTLLAQMTALGWRVLAERSGHADADGVREIVVGAVTKPWEADVVFRGLPASQFDAFREPGYVKIAWTLRAEPDGAGASIFRTETRVVATDAAARRRFRWYWMRFSPGILLIRRMALRLVKREAEQRAAARRNAS